MAASGRSHQLMLGRMRRALERIGLPAWFIVIDLLWIAKPDTLAVDARHYQRAASAWLAGGNPFEVMEGPATYLSGPHTLLFYAPTSVLPLLASTWLWMGFGLLASIWLIRRLELAWWWLCFPPLAHAIWNGNPQSIALALLVSGGSLAAAAAIGLKLYTGLALYDRPRAMVVAAVFLVITLPLLPWQEYLAQGAAISDHFGTAWNGSAWRFPLLVPIVAVALILLRRRDGPWYAVGAIWPATQFYYVGMALPAVARRPVLAALLALPVPLMTPLIVIALAGQRVRAELGRPPAPRSDPSQAHRRRGAPGGLLTDLLLDPGAPPAGPLRGSSSG